jgi:hypothetical protein
MRQDMSTDWFADIYTSKECVCPEVALDLVGLVHLR